MRPTSSRIAYRNPWTAVREDEIVYGDGTTGLYGVVEKPDFAVVLAQAADGRFCLVEQYRYPVQRRAWELPQGSWGPGRSGTPEELARAELREETGLTAEHWQHLGRLHPAYGLVDFAFDAWLATGLQQGPVDREATEQDMRSGWASEDELVTMVRDGLVVDAVTVAAWALLRLAA